LTRLVICGILGRMGAEVAEQIELGEEFSLAGGVESEDHPGIGTERYGITITASLEDCAGAADAVIDFTTPEASMSNIETCARLGKPVVVGTTGFSSEQLSRIEELSGVIPLLVSPNMSSGVNLLLRLVREIASGPLDFDIEISETHHAGKIDAPSGTALRIADTIEEVRKGCHKVFGRKGAAGPREKGEIGIHSIRGGDVVGEHRVIFASRGETLEVTHRALSRKAFAAGALLAAGYLTGAESGLYSMDDVFGGSTGAGS